MISVKLNIFSNVLSMHNDCRILFPDETGTNETLPVLWLCHGGSGDEDAWLYYSHIAELPDLYRIAVILVNANDSCFTDMAYGLNYASYIGTELPEILYRMFPRLSDRRENNFISGLSNGGYGCLLIGLTYPERFRAIGAFSAGDKADSSYVRSDGTEITPRIRMFGADDIYETRYSVRYLARCVSEGTGKKPYIYHACGSLDPWLDLNLLVKQTMEELDDPAFSYVYEQFEGLGHEWKLWDAAVLRFLNYLTDHSLLQKPDHTAGK